MGFYTQDYERLRNQTYNFVEFNQTDFIHIDTGPVFPRNQLQVKFPETPNNLGCAINCAEGPAPPQSGHPSPPLLKF